MNLEEKRKYQRDFYKIRRERKLAKEKKMMRDYIMNIKRS